MANPLFNMLAGKINQSPVGDILSQYKMVQNDPGKILDILLYNGKINQQQYNEMQSIKNNPQQIVDYLSQHGNARQLNDIKNIGRQFSGFNN